MNERKIEELIDFIEREKKQIHSLVIMKNGKVVTDMSFNGYSSREMHPIYSCTKSITSALIGRAIEDGFIENINQKVLDFFPDIKVDEVEKEEMTIDNLLTMTAGLKWDDRIDYDGMWDSENPVKYFFDKHVESTPGSKFNYCSGVVHILQFILEKVTKEDTLSYCKRVLLEPLGIENVKWERENNLLGSLEISPLDFIKIGNMYLNKGMWQGKEIVPAKWIDKSTTKHVDTPNNLNEVTNFGAGYGYMWWKNHFGGYHANGFGGQYMFIMPDEELVVVFTAEIFGEDFFMPQLAVEKYII